MSAGSAYRPLRVEQALRLLPDVGALAPLRAFLISTSRAYQPARWTSAEPYSTVGKRFLQPADLRARMPQALGRVTEHLTALYEAAVDALESEQRGDLTAAVLALLHAGEREEGVGRYAQAHQWYRHALGIAEELRDRRPEITALRRLGRLEIARGHVDEGGRALQRSLALAEAEMDAPAAAEACRGLGEVALAQDQWQGAEAWLTRGQRHADADPRLVGRLTLALAEVSRHRGEYPTATERLHRARRAFDESGDAEGTVLALHAQGALQAAQGATADAQASYQEALQRLHGARDDPSLEMSIRLSLCELHLASSQLRAAEDEIRRAEELAIANNFSRQLARLYVVLGKVRGHQEDEDGFVFFEKALELCGGLEPSPRLEAQVYVEYARFRLSLGDREAARGYLERARQIYDLLDEPAALERVEGELERLPPP